jgi:magnesium-transporting ATPase (P-type)
MRDPSSLRVTTTTGVEQHYSAASDADGSFGSRSPELLEEIDLESQRTSANEERQQRQQQSEQERSNGQEVPIEEVPPNSTKYANRVIHMNDTARNQTYKVPWIYSISPKGWKIKPIEFKLPFVKRQLFPDNRVSTTQYLWWNFIPINFLFLNLLQQYKLVHNWYFLVVMIFTLIPGVSPVFPITSVFPVVFILAVNMIKDGAEDFSRYLKDRQTNNKKIKIVRDGGVVEVSTGSILAGQIVVLTSEDIIPSDILILATSNPDNKCYVETAQLDGETNMKPKFGKSATQYLNDASKFTNFTGDLTCNAPDRELHNFDGTITFADETGARREEIVGSDNLILKGSVLKNTATLYGVAVYTGKESKIMLNTAKRKHKFSFIDRRVNLILAFLIALHQAICILFVVMSSVMQVSNHFIL